MIKNNVKNICLILLLAAFIITFWAYQHGLPGDFIFDDYVNLKTLSDHGGVKDLQSLRLYLDSGFAGPTGRPISMASFLLDARDWPADPGALKYKNILLHIVNGGLLFLVLVLMLQGSAVIDDKGLIYPVALLSTVFWLLHPYWVSTVLYTIQRMAELSTLFVLLGMAGYFWSRQWLRDKPKAAYLGMTMAIVIGTVMATYSKENGALLPMLLLIAEYSLFYNDTSARPNLWWRIIFLYVPSALVVGLVIQKGVLPHAFDTRPFTLSQRLLTEPRIIFDYLYQLIIPHAQTLGLFRDDYPVSTSLIRPATTLTALIALFGLLMAAIVKRKKYPLLSFSVLFFLAAHWMESSFLSLELYFEHRNYLPATMLFLPLAYLLVKLGKNATLASIFASVILIAVLVALLTTRATLWGDNNRLYLDWAEKNPESIRAQLMAASVLDRAYHRSDLAIERLNNTLKNHENSLMLHLNLARLKQSKGMPLGKREMKKLLELAKVNIIDGQVLASSEKIVSDILEHNYKAPQLTSDYFSGFLKNLANNPHLSSDPSALAKVYHELGRLVVNYNQRQALEYFDKALSLSGTTGMAIYQAAILATHGLHCEALARLENADTILNDMQLNQARSEYYAREISRLKKIISEEARGNGCTNKSILMSNHRKGYR